MFKKVKLILMLTAIFSTITLFGSTWKEIKKTKTLTIATRLKPGVYEKQGNKISGFQYLLIKSFAKEKGLTYNKNDNKKILIKKILNAKSNSDFDTKHNLFS